MMQIWSEQGYTDKKVEVGTVYHVLRSLNLPDDPQYYRRVRAALDRLAGTTFYTHNAIWNPKKRTYWPEYIFSIIDNVSYGKEEIFESLGMSAPMGTVTFTDAMLLLVRHGYFKPTNVERYWRLKTPYARRLFQFLDKRRINGKVQRFDLVGFVKKLGTLDETLANYKPSDVKRILEPNLKALIKDGYLEAFTWLSLGKRTYLEVRYVGEDGQRPTLSGREQALLDEIVDAFDEEGSRRYYEKVVSEVGQEKLREIYNDVRLGWEAGRVKNPGAVMVSLLQPERAAKANHRERAQVIAACRLCDDKGTVYFEGRKGERTILPCPHDLLAVRAIETIRGIQRLSL
jgi:hypothetical protein